VAQAAQGQAVSRKQFLIVLAVLLALGAAAAAIVFSDNESWRGDAGQAGRRIVPDLKLSDVAEIAVAGAPGAVHLARTDRGWVVRERADFPADVERIRDLLLKLADARAAQAEPLPESQRARLQLLEPKDKGTKDAGTVLELKDAKGKVLAHLLLGKKVFRQTDVAGPASAPPEATGRYLLAGADAGTMLVVADPLTAAEPRPEPWLRKELLRAERVKSVTSIGADRRTRWTLVREKDNTDWRFAASADRPDLQKATDAAGAFGWMDVVDVVVDPQNTETGLSRAITLRAETFDNLTYTVRIGDRTGDNYYVAVAVSGEPPQARTPEKGETAEEKEKRDKLFAEDKARLVERLGRERPLDGWRYMVGKNAIEPLLRDRAQMLPEKKTGRKNATKGGS
jgi:uncharacterized protein DUF4340